MALTSCGDAYAQQQAANNLWHYQVSSNSISKKGNGRTKFAQFAVLTNWATITDFDRVERTLKQEQREADKLIAEKKAEQAKALALFKKDKMTEDRWEVEDAICEIEMASHEADGAKLVARLAKTRYTPEYLADLRATCEAISCGYEHFTLQEKHHTYELLDLTARLAIRKDARLYTRSVFSTQNV